MKEGEQACNLDPFRPLSLAGSKKKPSHKLQAGSSAKAVFDFVPISAPWQNGTYPPETETPIFLRDRETRLPFLKKGGLHQVGFSPSFPGSRHVSTCSPVHSDNSGGDANSDTFRLPIPIYSGRSESAEKAGCFYRAIISLSCPFS